MAKRIQSHPFALKKKFLIKIWDVKAHTLHEPLAELHQLSTTSQGATDIPSFSSFTTFLDNNVIRLGCFVFYNI